MNKRTEWLLKPSPLFSIDSNIKSPLPIKTIKQRVTPGTVTSSWTVNSQATLISNGPTPENRVFGKPMWYWKSLRPVLP